MNKFSFQKKILTLSLTLGILVLNNRWFWENIFPSLSK